MKVFYLCFTLLSLLGGDLETSPAPIKVSINDKVELNEQMIKADDSQYNTLYFGFDLRSTLQEDARQYLPFLQYLESSTGYRFKLRFTKKIAPLWRSWALTIFSLQPWEL